MRGSGARSSNSPHNAKSCQSRSPFHKSHHLIIPTISPLHFHSQSLSTTANDKNSAFDNPPTSPAKKRKTAPKSTSNDTITIPAKQRGRKSADRATANAESPATPPSDISTFKRSTVSIPSKPQTTITLPPASPQNSHFSDITGKLLKQTKNSSTLAHPILTAPFQFNPIPPSDLPALNGNIPFLKSKVASLLFPHLKHKKHGAIDDTTGFLSEKPQNSSRSAENIDLSTSSTTKGKKTNTTKVTKKSKITFKDPQNGSLADIPDDFPINNQNLLQKNESTKITENFENLENLENSENSENKFLNVSNFIQKYQLNEIEGTLLSYLYLDNPLQAYHIFLANNNYKNIRIHTDINNSYIPIPLGVDSDSDDSDDLTQLTDTIDLNKKMNLKLRKSWNNVELHATARNVTVNTHQLPIDPQTGQPIESSNHMARLLEGNQKFYPIQLVNTLLTQLLAMNLTNYAFNVYNVMKQQIINIFHEYYGKFANRNINNSSTINNPLPFPPALPFSNVLPIFVEIYAKQVPSMENLSKLQQIYADHEECALYAQQHYNYMLLTKNQTDMNNLYNIIPATPPVMTLHQNTIKSGENSPKIQVNPSNLIQCNTLDYIYHIDVPETRDTSNHSTSTQTSPAPVTPKVYPYPFVLPVPSILTLNKHDSHVLNNSVVYATAIALAKGADYHAPAGPTQTAVSYSSHFGDGLLVKNSEIDEKSKKNHILDEYNRILADLEDLNKGIFGDDNDIVKELGNVPLTPEKVNKSVSNSTDFYARLQFKPSKLYQLESKFMKKAGELVSHAGSITSNISHSKVDQNGNRENRTIFGDMDTGLSGEYITRAPRPRGIDISHTSTSNIHIPSRISRKNAKLTKNTQRLGKMNTFNINAFIAAQMRYKLRTRGLLLTSPTMPIPTTIISPPSTTSTPKFYLKMRKSKLPRKPNNLQPASYLNLLSNLSLAQQSALKNTLPTTTIISNPNHILSSHPLPNSSKSTQLMNYFLLPLANSKTTKNPLATTQMLLEQSTLIVSKYLRNLSTYGEQIDLFADDYGDASMSSITKLTNPSELYTVFTRFAPNDEKSVENPIKSDKNTTTNDYDVKIIPNEYIYKLKHYYPPTISPLPTKQSAFLHNLLLNNYIKLEQHAKITTFTHNLFFLRNNKLLLSDPLTSQTTFDLLYYYHITHLPKTISAISTAIRLLHRTVQQKRFERGLLHETLGSLAKITPQNHYKEFNATFNNQVFLDLEMNDDGEIKPNYDITKRRQYLAQLQSLRNDMIYNEDTLKLYNTSLLSVTSGIINHPAQFHINGQADLVMLSKLLLGDFNTQTPDKPLYLYDVNGVYYQPDFTDDQNPLRNVQNASNAINYNLIKTGNDIYNTIISDNIDYSPFTSYSPTFLRTRRRSLYPHQSHTPIEEPLRVQYRGATVTDYERVGGPEPINAPLYNSEERPVPYVRVSLAPVPAEYCGTTYLGYLRSGLLSSDGPVPNQYETALKLSENHQHNYNFKKNRDYRHTGDAMSNDLIPEPAIGPIPLPSGLKDTALTKLPFLDDAIYTLRGVADTSKYQNRSSIFDLKLCTLNAAYSFNSIISGRLTNEYIEKHSDHFPKDSRLSAIFPPELAHAQGTSFLKPIAPLSFFDTYINYTKKEKEVSTDLLNNNGQPYAIPVDRQLSIHQSRDYSPLMYLSPYQVNGSIFGLSNTTQPLTKIVASRNHNLVVNIHRKSTEQQKMEENGELEPDFDAISGLALEEGETGHISDPSQQFRDFSHERAQYRAQRKGVAHYRHDSVVNKAPFKVNRAIADEIIFKKYHFDTNIEFFSISDDFAKRKDYFYNYNYNDKIDCEGKPFQKLEHTEFGELFSPTQSISYFRLPPPTGLALELVEPSLIQRFGEWEVMQEEKRLYKMNLLKIKNFKKMQKIKQNSQSIDITDDIDSANDLKDLLCIDEIYKQRELSFLEQYPTNSLEVTQNTNSHNPHNQQNTSYSTNDALISSQYAIDTYKSQFTSALNETIEWLNAINTLTELFDSYNVDISLPILHLTRKLFARHNYSEGEIKLSDVIFNYSRIEETKNPQDATHSSQFSNSLTGVYIPHDIVHILQADSNVNLTNLQPQIAQTAKAVLRSPLNESFQYFQQSYASGVTSSMLTTVPRAQHPAVKYSDMLLNIGGVAHLFAEIEQNTLKDVDFSLVNNHISQFVPHYTSFDMYRDQKQQIISTIKEQITEKMAKSSQSAHFFGNKTLTVPNQPENPLVIDKANLFHIILAKSTIASGIGDSTITTPRPNHHITHDLYQIQQIFDQAEKLQQFKSKNQQTSEIENKSDAFSDITIENVINVINDHPDEAVKQYIPALHAMKWIDEAWAYVHGIDFVELLSPMITQPSPITPIISKSTEMVEESKNLKTTKQFQTSSQNHSQLHVSPLSTLYMEQYHRLPKYNFSEITPYIPPTTPSYFPTQSPHAILSYTLRLLTQHQYSTAINYILSVMHSRQPISRLVRDNTLHYILHNSEVHRINPRLNLLMTPVRAAMQKNIHNNNIYWDVYYDEYGKLKSEWLSELTPEQQQKIWDIDQHFIAPNDETLDDNDNASSEYYSRTNVFGTDSLTSIVHNHDKVNKPFTPNGYYISNIKPTHINKNSYQHAVDHFDYKTSYDRRLQSITSYDADGNEIEQIIPESSQSKPPNRKNGKNGKNGKNIKKHSQLNIKPNNIFHANPNLTREYIGPNKTQRWTDLNILNQHDYWLGFLSSAEYMDFYRILMINDFLLTNHSQIGVQHNAAARKQTMGHTTISNIFTFKQSIDNMGSSVPSIEPGHEMDIGVRTVESSFGAKSPENLDNLIHGDLLTTADALPQLPSNVVSAHHPDIHPTMLQHTASPSTLALTLSGLERGPSESNDHISKTLMALDRPPLVPLGYQMTIHVQKTLREISPYLHAQRVLAKHSKVHSFTNTQQRYPGVVPEPLIHWLWSNNTHHSGIIDEHYWEPFISSTEDVFDSFLGYLLRNSEHPSDFNTITQFGNTFSSALLQLSLRTTQPNATYTTGVANYQQDYLETLSQSYTQQVINYELDIIDHERGILNAKTNYNSRFSNLEKKILPTQSQVRGLPPTQRHENSQRKAPSNIFASGYWKDITREYLRIQPILRFQHAIFDSRDKMDTLRNFEYNFKHKLRDRIEDLSQIASADSVRATENINQFNIKMKEMLGEIKYVRNLTAKPSSVVDNMMKNIIEKQVLNEQLVPGAKNSRIQRLSEFRQQHSKTMNEKDLLSKPIIEISNPQNALKSSKKHQNQKKIIISTSHTLLNDPGKVGYNDHYQSYKVNSPRKMKLKLERFNCLLSLLQTHHRQSALNNSIIGDNYTSHESIPISIDSGYTYYSSTIHLEEKLQNELYVCKQLKKRYNDVQNAYELAKKNSTASKMSLSSDPKKQLPNEISALLSELNHLQKKLQLSASMIDFYTSSISRPLRGEMRKVGLGQRTSQVFIHQNVFKYQNSRCHRSSDIVSQNLNNEDLSIQVTHPLSIITKTILPVHNITPYLQTRQPLMKYRGSNSRLDVFKSQRRRILDSIMSFGNINNVSITDLMAISNQVYNGSTVSALNHSLGASRPYQSLHSAISGSSTTQLQKMFFIKDVNDNENNTSVYTTDNTYKNNINDVNYHFNTNIARNSDNIPNINQHVIGTYDIQLKPLRSPTYQSLQFRQRLHHIAQPAYILSDPQNSNVDQRLRVIKSFSPFIDHVQSYDARSGSIVQEDSSSGVPINVQTTHGRIAMSNNESIETNFVLSRHQTTSNSILETSLQQHQFQEYNRILFENREKLNDNPHNTTPISEKEFNQHVLQYQSDSGIITSFLPLPILPWNCLPKRTKLNHQMTRQHFGMMMSTSTFASNMLKLAKFIIPTDVLPTPQTLYVDNFNDMHIKTNNDEKSSSQSSYYFNHEKLNIMLNTIYITLIMTIVDQSIVITSTATDRIKIDQQLPETQLDPSDPSFVVTMVNAPHIMLPQYTTERGNTTDVIDPYTPNSAHYLARAPLASPSTLPLSSTFQELSQNPGGLYLNNNDNRIKSKQLITHHKSAFKSYRETEQERLNTLLSYACFDDDINFIQQQHRNHSRHNILPLWLEFSMLSTPIEDSKYLTWNNALTSQISQNAKDLFRTSMYSNGAGQSINQYGRHEHHRQIVEHEGKVHAATEDILRENSVIINNPQINVKRTHAPRFKKKDQMNINNESNVDVDGTYNTLFASASSRYDNTSAILNGNAYNDVDENMNNLQAQRNWQENVNMFGDYPSPETPNRLDSPEFFTTIKKIQPYDQINPLFSLDSETDHDEIDPRFMGDDSSVLSKLRRAAATFENDDESNGTPRYNNNKKWEYDEYNAFKTVKDRNYRYGAGHSNSRSYNNLRM